MKNYKNILKRLVVLLSLIIIQTSLFAQTIPIFPGTGGSTSLPGGTSFTLPGIASGYKPNGGDDICKATKIKTGLACTQFSNDSASASSTPAKPSCWADANKDVWFSFVATAQDMTISTDAVIFELFPGTTCNDTELAVYKSNDGTCSNISEIGCDLDYGINSGIDLSKGVSGPTRQAMVEKTGLIPGNLYYVRVHNKAAATAGNFCLSVFDTYTVGSKPCEAQVVHPNNMACDKYNGNMVINTTSEGPGGSIVNTIQPGAYVPIGQTWAGCSPTSTATQYGTWSTFTAESSGGGSITVANSSGNAVDYTLFSGVCTSPKCIEYKSCAVGGTVTFSSITAGTKYYILTTLTSGAPTVIVKTDLCVTNASPPVHPQTDYNLNNVPGAGGSAQADHCPAFEIVVDQVYKTTTYAADKDGAATCAYGKNVWFTWKVPSNYPKTSTGQSAAFFQMWNKNCNSGPGSIGTRLIVGAQILGDPCNGSCLEFSSPSQTGASGSSGDIDPYTDAATNVGWDPSAYGNQYWGVFQSGNDGSGNAKEVCDFNFMIGSTPSLKGIAVDDKTICLGQSVTLTASGGTAYEWALTGNPTTTSVSVTPTVAGLNTYTVTATAGADGYAVSTVTVIDYPTVNATNGAICSGSSSATLTANGTAQEYFWSPATNLNVTTGTKVLANPSATKTYTVTGTNGRGGTFAGCSAWKPAIVTVGGNIPVFVNNGVICPGQSAVLNASGADTYTWTPATNLSSVNGATVNANPASPTVYTVTGEINGCKGTAQSNVTLSPTPTITVNSVSICTGLTANLTAAGGSTYSWNTTPVQTTASITTAAMNGTPGTVTPFVVTGTSAAGCSSSATANVTIQNGLTITISGGVGVCLGNANTLTAAGGVNYTWSPSTFLNTTSGATVTSTPTSTTTYTVLADDGAGCTGSKDVTVSVTPLDDASFSYSGVTFCNVVGTYTATKTVPGAGSFAINPAGSLSLDSNTGSISIDGTTTLGKYDIIYTSTANCTNSYTVTVTVVGIPDANFSYTGPYCEKGSTPATVTQTPTQTPGTFTSTGGLNFVSATTGEINLATSTPGTYSVTNTIAAGGGCPLATGGNSVTITPLPSITVTSPPAVCSGSTATITAVGATTYVWTGGAGTFTTSGAGGSDLSDNPTAASTTYNVTGTTSGCSSTASGMITVNSLPTITVNTPAAICAGQSASITASGATSYSWTGGVAPSGVATATITDSPLATTNYTVTGTSAGCTSAPVQGTITINPTPIVSATPSTICTGSTGATLTANGATTYTWAPGNLTGTTINVNPATTTVYTITGSTGGGGCSGVSTTTVTVNTTPILSAIPPFTGCIGAMATLTASAPNVANTISWTMGAVPVGNGTSLSVPVTGSAPVIYTATAVSTIDATCKATKTGTVSGIASPTVTVTGSNTICLGDLTGVKLTANVVPATPASIFTWTPNTGASGATLTDSPTAAGLYTYSVSANNGCPSQPASGFIKVDPLPVVTISDTTAICSGSTLTLKATGTPDITIYTWTPGGDGTSITITPTKLSNMYVVEGKTALGCTDTAMREIKTYPIPQADFTEPKTVKLSEANIRFDDKSKNAESWFWDFGDDGTSILQNPEHQYNDTGSFVIWLKVENKAGCSSVTKHEVYILPDVLVFVPNSFTPNGDDLNDGFKFKGQVAPGGFEFRIFDRWGQQMFFTTDRNAEWKGDFKGVPCQEDVYVYTILIKDSFGKEKKYLGHVTLTR